MNNKNAEVHYFESRNTCRIVREKLTMPQAQRIAKSMSGNNKKAVAQAGEYPNILFAEYENGHCNSASLAEWLDN